MSQDVPSRPVLLVAGGACRDRLRALFDRCDLAGWHAEPTGSLEQAHFLLLGYDCVALVLDEGLCPEGDFDGLRWLARQTPQPILVLGDSEAVGAETALRNGAALWLPRDLVLARPIVLEAALRQLAGSASPSSRTLRDCQERVLRLLDLLWEATPSGTLTGWYTHRHLLQRLEEEVVRTRREGRPLTVVLGEVRPNPPATASDAQLAAHTADRIGRCKRRSDVAGRYGLQGFMLVLPSADVDQAVACCERLRPLLEVESVGPLPPVRAYFGVASAGGGAVTVSGLLGRAEERLEEARSRGGGVVAES